MKNEEQKTLPRPSDAFIEKYIEKYNKGEIITDVMVEYELDTILAQKQMYFIKTNNSIKNAPTAYKLKVNPKDNTITIKSVKDSWNREEIIQDIEQAMIKGLNIGEYRDKWIEK